METHVPGAWDGWEGTLCSCIKGLMWCWVHHLM